MERKALERLVDALMDMELDGNRVEAIESALMSALVALEGHEFNERDEADLEEILDNLAVEVLVRRLRAKDLSIYRIVVDPVGEAKDTEDRVEIVATSHPMLSGILDHGIQQLLKEESPFDVN